MIVPLKERMNLIRAVEALLDDPDISVDCADAADASGSYAALMIEADDRSGAAFIRIDEMVRDIRLGFYTELEVARDIVMLYSIAYRHRAAGTLIRMMR